MNVGDWRSMTFLLIVVQVQVNLHTTWLTSYAYHENLGDTLLGANLGGHFHLCHESKSSMLADDA